MKTYQKHFSMIKIFLYGMILVIAFCSYQLFFAEHRAEMSVNIVGQTPENTPIQVIQGVMGVTDGLAEMECKSNTDTEFECDGKYVTHTAYNFGKYHKRLNKFVEANNLQLTVLGGGFIWARWLD